jgi:MFS superfamily sulfate permease-like transporter
MVGLVMAAFGLLRLGSLVGFVSNAVMTGFTTGIALQIITGVLKAPGIQYGVGSRGRDDRHLPGDDGFALARRHLPRRGPVACAVLRLSVARSNLVALRPGGADHPDRWRIVPVPETAPSRAVTVLHYWGTGLFAELPRIDERWPQSDETRDAVIILSIRTLPDIPSTTLLKWLERKAKTLESQGVRLMLVGRMAEVYAGFLAHADHNIGRQR